MAGASNQTIIKKYANRRVYNTQTSTYITFEDLQSLIKTGEDFCVLDAKTHEDLTRNTLLQILTQDASEKTSCSNTLLRKLISSPQQQRPFLREYLDLCLHMFVRQQDKLPSNADDTPEAAQVQPRLKSVFSFLDISNVSPAEDATDAKDQQIEALKEQVRKLNEELTKLRQSS